MFMFPIDLLGDSQTCTLIPFSKFDCTVELVTFPPKRVKTVVLGPKRGFGWKSDVLGSKTLHETRLGRVTVKTRFLGPKPEVLGSKTTFSVQKRLLTKKPVLVQRSMGQDLWLQLCETKWNEQLHPSDNSRSRGETTVRRIWTDVWRWDGTGDL